MKFLLFALGLALCCVVQAGWEEVTTCSKEDLGRWVSFAIACNSPEAVEQIKHMPAFVADVSKPKEDVFSISALIPMPDGCKKVTHQFRKGEDGKYQSFSGRTVTQNTEILQKFKEECRNLGYKEEEIVTRAKASKQPGAAAGRVSGLAQIPRRNLNK
ncbi:hypothetical protein E2320_006578 [Naja naja]|nr:hypothetical protein E2320_006578 [Naja naja]